MSLSLRQLELLASYGDVAEPALTRALQLLGVAVSIGIEGPRTLAAGRIAEPIGSGIQGPPLRFTLHPTGASQASTGCWTR